MNLVCDTVPMNNKELAAWLRQRLNKSLPIDNWQRTSLVKLLKDLENDKE